MLHSQHDSHSHQQDTNFMALCHYQRKHFMSFCCQQNRTACDLAKEKLQALWYFDVNKIQISCQLVTKYRLHVILSLTRHILHVIMRSKNTGFMSACHQQDRDLMPYCNSQNTDIMSTWHQQNTDFMPPVRTKENLHVSLAKTRQRFQYILSTNKAWTSWHLVNNNNTSQKLSSSHQHNTDCKSSYHL